MTQQAPVAIADDPTKARLRLWLKLLKVSRQIEAEVRENLRAEFSSTLPRFDVLAALDRFPKGLRMSELSGVLKVSNGNVTGIVDRLVADKLVIRSAVPGDRRAMTVRLTKRGAEEFQRQAAKHEEWIGDMLANLTAADADQLAAGLELVFQQRDQEDTQS